MFAQLVAQIAQKFGLSSDDAASVVRAVLGFLDHAPEGLDGIAARLKALGLPAAVDSWSEAAAPVLTGAQALALIGEGAVAPLAHDLHKDTAETASALGFTLPKVLGLLADHGSLPSALPAAAQTFLKGPVVPPGLAPDRLVDSRLGDWVARGVIFFAALGILWWLTPKTQPQGSGHATPTAAAPAAAGHGASAPAAAGHGASAPAASGHAAAPATAAPTAAAPAASHAAPTSPAAAPAPHAANPAPAVAPQAAAPPASAASQAQALAPAAQTTAPSAPKLLSRLTVRQIGDIFYYGGAVPDVTVAEKVRTIVGEAFGADGVKGEVTVDPRVAPPGWLEKLSGILAAIQSKGFNIALDDAGLTFRALAPDADRAALQARLAGFLQGGALVLPDPAAPRLDAAGARAALDALTPGYGGAEVAKTLNRVAIEFDTASATVPAEDKDVLVKAAVLIKALPSGAVVVIEGYTDNVGDAAANLALSQQRADAVKAILVAAGLAPESIEATGYGEANPVAANDTDEGRSHNRRITYEVRPR